RPGRRSVHNGLYWSGAGYLGVGASAASFRPLTDGSGWRFTNPRATDTYLRDPRPADAERRAAAALENEALWLGLRTSDGVGGAALHPRRLARHGPQRDERSRGAGPPASPAHLGRPHSHRPRAALLRRHAAPGAQPLPRRKRGDPRSSRPGGLRPPGGHAAD